MRKSNDHHDQKQGPADDGNQIHVFEDGWSAWYDERVAETGLNGNAMDTAHEQNPCLLL